MPKSGETDRIATYQVRVLDRAVDILEAFTAQRKDLSIPEIVAATGLNRSTTIRLVANLERRGLLQKDPAANRFRLGHRLFEMGSLVYSSLSVLEAAAGPLSALEQRSGATILLAVREGDHSIMVDKRQGVGDGFAMVPMPGEVGEIRPLTYGLAGQVILSTLTRAETEVLLSKYPLEKHTPYSITDRRQYLARLPQGNERGYAIEVNEVVEGLMGIAAPIFDFSGSTVGALSLGFPATREADRQFVDAAIGDLKQAAAEASANLGYAATSEDVEKDGSEDTEAPDS